MKRILVLLTIGLLASISVIAASPAGAKKGPPKAHGVKAAKRVVHGVVESVDSDSVTLKAKKGAAKTVAIDENTKIFVNGHASSLASVEIGYRAVAKLPKGGGPAQVLRAHQPPAPGTVVSGLVASVDSDSITLTKKDGSSVTIPVNGDTKIRVNGKPGSLSDVGPGDRAVVRRTSADGPAATINAGENRGRRAVNGVVDAVGANSITIKQRNGASATIDVTGDTKIRVKGHSGAAALSDIHVGYKAEVIRSGSDGPALAIVAKPPKN